MISKKDINPQDAISMCLKNYFEIDKYVWIVERIKQNDFQADSEFRKKYNSFYKVMFRNSEWYEWYYGLLENQKGAQKPFKDIITDSMEKFGKIEVSFASKLIASVDPEKPIWDQYILKNLGLDNEWESVRNLDPKKRIDKAVIIYNQIEKIINDSLNTEEGKALIQWFDSVLPEYKGKITNVKKYDFFLWGIK